MDSLVLGLVAFLTLFVLLAIRVPVGYAMILVAFLGTVATDGFKIGISELGSVIFWFSTSYAFSVIPLFLFMGSLVGNARLVYHVYRGATYFLRRLRGALAYGTTMAATLFAACSGSTTASVVTFTRVTLPEMEKYEYNKGFVIGIVAAAGTLATMIPPSAGMVIYSMLTDESLGEMFIAGIIPGIMNGILLLVCIRTILYFRPNYAPKVSSPPLGRREKVAFLVAGLGMLSLFLLVMGGIYFGIFTPSQAGAVGAAGAVVLFFAYCTGHRLRQFGTSVYEAVLSSAEIFVILIGGLFFSRFLVRTRIMVDIMDSITVFDPSPVVIMGLFILLYLIMGMFLSSSAVKVLLVPLFYPILVTKLGFDGIWLGILTSKLGEIGECTPPIGTNIFAAVAASDGRLTLEEGYKGILPFLPVDFFLLGVIIAFPKMILWLPGLME